jgi:hypothetical protein
LSVGMNCVSLVELKSWARRRLPPSDPVRVAIEAQLEAVPVEEFVVLLKQWDLMMTIR